MYLGSEKINKINLGSTEVKKVYQGSDLIWTNKLNYIYDFRNGTLSFPDTPNITSLSYLALENPEVPTVTNLFSHGWTIASSSSYKCLLPRSNTNLVSSYRSGYMIFYKSGNYRITVNYMVEPFSKFYVHASDKNITTTTAIESSTNRKIYCYNNTGSSGSAITATESFEITVPLGLTETSLYYVTFSAYRYRGSSYWTFPVIYSIQVEEL